MSAPSVHTALGPLCFVSRVFGLFPFDPARAPATRWQVLYTAIVLVLLTLCFAFTIVWKILEDYQNLTLVFLLTDIFDLCSATATSISCLLFSVIFHKYKMNYFMSRIVFVDDILVRISDNCNLKYGEIRSLLIKLMVVISMYSTAMFSYDNWVSTGTVFDPKYVTKYLAHTINMIVTLQYSTFVHVLRSRFAMLNTMLETPVHVMGRAARYRCARKLHICLCDAAAQVNSMYGLLILMEVTCIFGNITFSLYIAITAALGLQTAQTDNTVPEIVGLSAGWILYSLLKLFVLTSSCRWAALTANLTANVAQHRLLLERAPSPAARELLLLSLQLSHYRLRFTACDFYTIDFTLLYSITGAVTTYIVILLQFQNASTK